MEPVKEFRFDHANLVKVQAGISSATVEVAPAHESPEPSAHDDMVCMSIQREADLFSSVGLTPEAALQVAAALVHAVTRMLPVASQPVAAHAPGDAAERPE